MARFVRSLMAAAVIALGVGCATSTPESDHGERAGLDLEGIALSGSPEPRAGAGLIYVSAYDVAVLHGGVGYSGDLMDDTWLFDVDTSTWWQIGGGPPASAFPSLTYDPDRNLIVALVGYGEGGGTTWTLDLATGGWAQHGAAVQRIVGDLITYHADFGAVVLVERNLWRLDVDRDRWSMIDGSRIEGFDQFREGSLQVTGALVADEATGSIYLWGATPATGEPVDPSTVWEYSLIDSVWAPNAPRTDRAGYEGAAADLIQSDRTIVALSLDYERHPDGAVARTPGMWLYDLGTSEWSVIAETGAPDYTSKPGVAYLPTVGKVLVVGIFGSGTSDTLTSTWLVDPASGVWELISERS